MAFPLSLPTIISPEFTDLLRVVLVLFVSFVAAKLTSQLIKILGKFASRTETDLDDRLIACLHKPVMVLFVFGGFFLALLATERLGPYFGQIEKAGFSLGIILVAWIISRVVNTVVDWYSERLSRSKGQRPLGFVKKMVAGFIMIGALVIVLESYGVEIGPLIAGLGIAGLAVALALKDTLENFFAGLYILADKPVRIGQVIQCSAGKGTVEDIGWRSIKLRTWENNVIIVPNAKLAADNITNFSSPEASLVVVDVGVDYRSDPEKTEKVLLEVGEKMIRKFKLDKTAAAPYVRFNNFGASSLDFSLRFRVPKYNDKFGIAHDTRKEVYRTFKKKGISIPFQTITVKKG